MKFIKIFDVSGVPYIVNLAHIVKAIQYIDGTTQVFLTDGKTVTITGKLADVERLLYN